MPQPTPDISGAAPPPALPVISGYRLISELGRGSSATVYLAIQESIGRKVALKVANAGSDDPAAAERFMLEAKIISRLSHPYIVAVHDVGAQNGRHFIAMEYLGGGNLKQRIGHGMNPTDAVRIVSQITQALDFAHDKGFLHRDIKPGNILFRQDGSPVLTDFGIARATSATALPAAWPQSSLPTSTKTTVVGTPRYMSPEQTRGKTLDRRSDLYSIGVLLFELLTGKVPFDGSDALDIGIKHLKSRVPLLPPALSGYQAVVDKMLAKNAEDRYQRGQTFINALQRVPPPQAQPQSQSGAAANREASIALKTPTAPRRLVLLAVLAILLIVMGLALGQSVANSELFNSGSLLGALH